MALTLAEVILQRLKDWDEIFDQHGMWNGDEYVEVVKPLHEALLILARTTEGASQNSLDGERVESFLLSPPINQGCIGQKWCQSCSTWITGTCLCLSKQCPTCDGPLTLTKEE